MGRVAEGVGRRSRWVRVSATDERTHHGTRRQDQNAADDLKGKAKEATGKATDDESLEAEGKGDQAKSDLKEAGEKVKDAFKH